MLRSPRAGVLYYIRLSPRAGKFCFAVVLPEGLSAIAIADKEYPTRVAVTMLKSLVEEVKTGEHACVCGAAARRWQN